MCIRDRPNSMIIVGSGAIGIEFAYFYNSLGTDVTVVEFQDRIAPNEDHEISKELEKILKKKNINILTSSKVVSSEISNDKVKVEIECKDNNLELVSDVVLSAVGIKSNIEDIGLEQIGVKVESDKILVNEFYKTNVDGIFAIGDIVSGQSLAHVASAEGRVSAEHINKNNVTKIDYQNIPGCTYCRPQVASIGLTEDAAKKAGFSLKVGRFPLQASGKALAIGEPDGMVKVIFDEKYGELLGCHIIGSEATELIAEAGVVRTLETTQHEILNTIHAHPTISESFMEAVADAYNEAIHI